MIVSHIVLFLNDLGGNSVLEFQEQNVEDGWTAEGI